jgi:DNA invertase Pin-like site-specific DNA recombinase
MRMTQTGWLGRLRHSRKECDMNCALYARVSTKGKRQDTENQLAQLRDFCATQGWTVVHECVDRVTGKHSDREQLQRLFQEASQRSNSHSPHGQ